MENMQRGKLRFEECLSSPATKKLYKYYLGKFCVWAKIDDPEQLLTLKDSFLQILLEDYLFHLKKIMNPNSIPPIFAALELFLSINDKTINTKKLHKMFPKRIKKTGQRAYTTAHVQKILSKAKEERTFTSIHFLAASGARLGGLEGLKLKHLQKMENCYCVKFYEGEVEEYYSFLTPEASEALDGYFEKRRKDGEYLSMESPVFRKSYRVGYGKAFPASSDSLRRRIDVIIKKSGIERIKTGMRFDIQTDHGFRKRFNTILKDNGIGNRSLVEKMMSHTIHDIPLDTVYHDATPEKLFEEYKLHIPNLTISDVGRKEAENLKLKKQLEIRESESQKALRLEIEELKKQVAETKQDRAKQSYSNALKIKNSDVMASLKAEIIGQIKRDMIKEGITDHRKNRT